MHVQCIAPFARLVSQIVMTDRRTSARAVAAALGLSNSAFHDRLNGRAEFTPDEISGLLYELRDVRLIECLIGGSGFIAVPLPKSDRQATRRTHAAYRESVPADVMAVSRSVDGAGQPAPQSQAVPISAGLGTLLVGTAMGAVGASVTWTLAMLLLP